MLLPESEPGLRRARERTLHNLKFAGLKCFYGFVGIAQVNHLFIFTSYSVARESKHLLTKLDPLLGKRECI